MADALHQRRAGAAGEFADHRVADFAIAAADLYLDQLVVFQRAIDFVHHRVGQALATDLQHRLQFMRLATQEAGLGRGQHGRHAAKKASKGAAGYHAGLMATRSKSSQRWLQEHFSDPYVKKAQAEGLRSRAAYKLEELVERDRLL